MSIVSCKKDTETGHAGSQGSAGNANVKSYTFSVVAADWVFDSTKKEWHAVHTLPSTADLSGGVSLYWLDGSAYSPYPFVDYGVAYHYGYDNATKVVELVAADANVTVSVPNPGGISYKVVTIP